jgi:hypothetical protein
MTTEAQSLSLRRGAEEDCGSADRGLRGFTTTLELQTPQENKVRDERGALSETPSRRRRDDSVRPVPRSILDDRQ